jgi:hypothetical protein
MTTPLTDILTAAKNIAVALNQLGQTYTQVMGNRRSDPITNTTGLLIASGQGRLVLSSLTTATGSVTMDLYDSNSASLLTNKIASVPASVGITQLNIPFTTGLVVVCPSAITGIVTYSLAQT